MARQARQFEFNNLYHIVNKFNPELWIDDGFLPGIEEIIAKAVTKFNVKITEFTILNNHFHMAVYFPKESKITISKFMQSIGTSIAIYVNKVLKRHGKVFKDRFYSIVIKTAKEFVNKLTYIRQNISHHRRWYDYKNWKYSSYKYYNGYKIKLKFKTSNKIRHIITELITHYNKIAELLFSVKNLKV